MLFVCEHNACDITSYEEYQGHCIVNTLTTIYKAHGSYLHELDSDSLRKIIPEVFHLDHRVANFTLVNVQGGTRYTVGDITDSGLTISNPIVFPGKVSVPPDGQVARLPISMNRNPGEWPDGRIESSSADLGMSGADIALKELEEKILFPEILPFHNLNLTDLFIG